MKTRSFKDLIVWQRAYQLVKEIYKATDNFPKHEVYGLSQQMRRATVSIPSNISEGYGRQYNKEYRQFLAMSYGSLCELETQYLLSVDLGYLKKNGNYSGTRHSRESGNPVITRNYLDPRFRGDDKLTFAISIISRCYLCT